MSSSLFPIVEVDKNRITSIEGNVSYFYKLQLPDFEQMDDITLNGFYNRIGRSLNNLPEKDYFKFYALSGELYLESNSEQINLAGGELLAQEKPLQVFLGFDQLFSEINFFEDYLLYNGRFTRILSAVEFSESPLNYQLIPDGIDYVLSFKRVDKAKSISRLEKIRSGHLSSFLKSKRDLSSEGAYSQAEDLLEDILHGSESLFEMQLFFLVQGYCLEELNQKTDELNSNLLGIGIKSFIEGQSLKKKKSGLATIFNELIPGVKPSFSLRMLPNKTTHLQYLLPLSNTKLTERGIEFHDIKDRPIYFEVFNKKFKNKNMLVSGMSGTGKSVFVNKLLHYLVEDHPAVILDMGGSYKRLALYHGGVELKAKFNPMHFRDPIYLREIILSMADKKDFDRLKRGKLLAAIKRALEKVETFFELLGELEKEFTGISYYFEEIREFVSDDPLTITNLLYVDIENLPRAIVAPMIIYILEYFNSIAQKDKILVFDECWEYLKDHADFVSRCFRTFRKTGAFPIAISQSLSDFSSKNNQLYSAITNNSYFNVLFPQQVTDESELTDFDISRINILDFEKGIFSECYLKTKDNSIRKIIRNYLTPLELELAHTESSEDEPLLNFIEKFQDYFNSTKQAIDAFVRLKYEDKEYFNLFTNLA